MTERRVLIVDDESSIRESLAEFLRDFGMLAETATNAEEALDLLAEKPFELLIADLRLPGMTGDVMIPKAHQLQPNLQFLIHTGSIDYRLSNELVALGLTPTQVILKPLSDLTILLDKIEALFKT
jgi:DNA-binding NtrC family response regulator